MDSLMKLVFGIMVCSIFFFYIKRREKLIKPSCFHLIGFACPIKNFVQYICCNKNNYRYCCPPDGFSNGMETSQDPIYLFGHYEPSNHIAIDQNYINVLINNSKLISRKFELFQKFFLPTFLLTSSVLFLIGIALWFWLYKYKAFYAVERDNMTKPKRIIGRPSQLMFSNLLTRNKNTVNLTMERNLQRPSYKSTEV